MIFGKKSFSKQLSHYRQKILDSLKKIKFNFLKSIVALMFGLFRMDLTMVHLYIRHFISLVWFCLKNKNCQVILAFGTIQFVCSLVLGYKTMHLIDVWPDIYYMIPYHLPFDIFTRNKMLYEWLIWAKYFFVWSHSKVLFHCPKRHSVFGCLL